MKYLTLKWLKKEKACESGIEYFKSIAPKSRLELKSLLENDIKNNRLDFFNWMISKKLKKLDKVRYAIYAAKQVIEIFEKKYPNDSRPRNAIKAAEKCLKNPTMETVRAAYTAAYTAADAADAAAYAADAAAYAADAAADAADAAANAADAAAYAADAADAAANAAYAAAYAADAADAAAYTAYAADAAAYAAVDARKKMQIKICKYGLQLFLGK